MLMWTLVLVLVSLVLMLGNFLHFPDNFLQLLPIITLLSSLGILYRMLYKSRLGTRERFTEKITRLEKEVEDLQIQLKEKCAS